VGDVSVARLGISLPLILTLYETHFSQGSSFCWLPACGGWEFGCLQLHHCITGEDDREQCGSVLCILPDSAFWGFRDLLL